MAHSRLAPVWLAKCGRSVAQPLSLPPPSLRCRQADTNADGRLGPRELLKLFKELGHPLTYDTLVKIFEGGSACWDTRKRGQRRPATHAVPPLPSHCLTVQLFAFYG